MHRTQLVSIMMQHTPISVLVSLCKLLALSSFSNCSIDYSSGLRRFQNSVRCFVLYIFAGLFPVACDETPGERAHAVLYHQIEHL